MIDGKEVGWVPLRKRVRNRMRTKRMKEAADFSDFADKKLRDGQRALEKRILFERLGIEDWRDKPASTVFDGQVPKNHAGHNGAALDSP